MWKDDLSKFINTDNKVISKGKIQYTIEYNCKDYEKSIQNDETKLITSKNSNFGQSDGTLYFCPKVTFEPKGGSGTMDDYLVGKTKNLQNTFVKQNLKVRPDGFEKFAGYTLDKEGNEKNYTLEDFTENSTLYAQWTHNKVMAHGETIPEELLNNKTIAFTKEDAADQKDFYFDNNKKGYRLPTDQEWEFAARGGMPDKDCWNYVFSGINVSKNKTVTTTDNKDEIKKCCLWY